MPPATPVETRAGARDAILDAAELLFARLGFAAATIKQIGAEAGVNPALLYYYFPDKQQLYQAVLDRRVGAFAREVPERIPPEVAPLEGIRLLLKAQVAFLRSSPHVPRLMARELADHEAANARPVLQELATGAFRRLCDLIRAGQAEGSIRPDLDPAFTAVSIIAQAGWFFVAQPALKQVLGYSGAVPSADIDRFMDHAIRFATAALAAPEGRSVPRGAGRRPRKRAKS
jgi:AcrR family transcriptional regulator